MARQGNVELLQLLRSTDPVIEVLVDFLPHHLSYVSYCHQAVLVVSTLTLEASDRDHPLFQLSNSTSERAELRMTPCPFDHWDNQESRPPGTAKLDSMANNPAVGRIKMNSTCRSAHRSQLIRLPRLPNGATWTGFQRTSGLIGAGLCVVLATLGIFLPLLPSTPFVLLASYLLCRSSPGMHHSFRNSRLFGRLLTDWEDRGGIRQKDKSRAIVVVLMCSGGTLCFGNLSATLTSMIVALVSVGLFVILRVPLVRDSE